MRTFHVSAATFRKLLHDRRAATAVEYGLIMALVVIAMSAGLKNFADAVIGMWNYVTVEVLKS